MRLVIGLAHSKSRNNIEFSFTSASGDSPINSCDIAPDGLRFDRNTLEPKARVNVIERFQKFGPTAIAELGEAETWPLVDALLDADDVRALFIYQGAPTYIASALAEGMSTDEALKRWRELITPMLTTLRRHRDKTVLIESNNALRSPGDFHFACKDSFDIDATVVEASQNIPLLGIYEVLATQLIAESPEIDEISAELDVSSLRISRKPRPLGRVALADLNTFIRSNQEMETLQRKGEENTLLRAQLYRVQTELEKRYKSVTFGADFEKKIAKHRHEIAQLKQDIVKIRSSSSWRITAPMRWGMQSMSGAFRLRTLLRTKRHAKLIRNSDYFDAVWYIAKYDDVAKMGSDPAEHYIRHGAREGRVPGPKFDSIAYLKANPDIAAANLNPLVHYLQHGKAEGRTLKPVSAKPR